MKIKQDLIELWTSVNILTERMNDYHPDTEEEQPKGYWECAYCGARPKVPESTATARYLYCEQCDRYSTVKWIPPEYRESPPADTPESKDLYWCHHCKTFTDGHHCCNGMTRYTRFIPAEAVKAIEGKARDRAERYCLELGIAETRIAELEKDKETWKRSSVTKGERIAELEATLEAVEDLIDKQYLHPENKILDIKALITQEAP